MLNEAHPRRHEFDALGLPTCPKATLFDEYQVILHMRHKHRAEMSMIEDRDAQAERKLDRALQRAPLQAVLGTQSTDEKAPSASKVSALNTTIGLDRVAKSRDESAAKRQSQ